jgi:peroxiredoxin
MNPRKRASPFIVFAAAILCAALLAWALPIQPAGPHPDLRLALLDGRTLNFAQFRGRPVLVTFWATNCAPCVEELPDLISLYRDLGPRGLELVAVAMAYDPPLNVQTFVRERAVPYPVALDVDGAIARAFDDVSFVPSAFIVDPQGRIIYRQIGKLDIAETLRALTPFLKEEPAV